MNTRIEQLTRNYLNNLNLPGWNSLSEHQKREIIRINGETEWIIFNAGSLKAKKLRTEARVPLLKTDEYDRVVGCLPREGYGLHIGEWIRRFGNRIGLVGEYFLGNSKSPTGEMEEELSEDGYNTPIGYRKTVWGRIRNDDGTVGTNPVYLRIWRKEVDLGFSPESYDITKPLLKQICKESLKLYYQTDDPDSLDADCFNFYGGDSITGADSTMRDHLGKRPAVPVDYSGEEVYWIAVNKEKMAKSGYEHDESTVIIYRSHWKKEMHLDNLLNDNEINNSHERGESASPSLSDNYSPGTNPPPQDTHDDQPHTPPSSTTQTIQFTIKNAWRDELDDINFFTIILESPITVNGRQIDLIEITGRKANTVYQNGDLQSGNTITITNVDLSPHKAILNDYDELSIGKFFDKIQVVTPNIGSDTPPDSPPNPPFFPETKQKNRELRQEEDKMLLLAEELLKVIEDNKKICQEAKQLGLNLPEIPTNALDYFQEEFFDQLDENQPLNSSHNSQIITENEDFRKKKLNIKKNIYGIYDNNKKKLAEKKTGGQAPPPKSELEKLKQELKERINQVLTNKDNLRNIDLSTLANGKYQNWEKDIEGLTTQDEVVAYANAFLAALKETGAKEKEREGKEKDNKTNSNNSQNSENTTIDDKTKKMINNLPLATAKNVAKNKIRELFNKYNPDLEKLKTLWGKEQNWMAYLEKCDSPEKVVAFLEKLERAMLAQQVQSQGNNKNKKPAPKNSWILPLLIIVLVALISLVIIIKLRYKRKK